MDAVRRTRLRAQRADGSWPYSEAHGWVDNFHTAYVLESLSHCEGVEDALARGAEYWRRELFDADGRPRYFPDSRLPLDAHSYASAVDAYLALGDDPRAGALGQASVVVSMTNR